MQYIEMLLKLSWVEFIGVLRHMQRYFSHICDDTDVQADWRSCTYGRAPNAIENCVCEVSYEYLCTCSAHERQTSILVNILVEVSFYIILHHIDLWRAIYDWNIVACDVKHQ